MPGDAWLNIQVLHNPRQVALIDGFWAVVGSTNLDARSFGWKDEVNVAMPDAGVVLRQEHDFEEDLKSSRQVSYAQWKSRPLWKWLRS